MYSFRFDVFKYMNAFPTRVSVSRWKWEPLALPKLYQNDGLDQNGVRNDLWTSHPQAAVICIFDEIRLFYHFSGFRAASTQNRIVSGWFLPQELDIGLLWNSFWSKYHNLDASGNLQSHQMSRKSLIEQPGTAKILKIRVFIVFWWLSGLRAASRIVSGLFLQ